MFLTNCWWLFEWFLLIFEWFWNGCPYTICLDELLMIVWVIFARFLSDFGLGSRSLNKISTTVWWHFECFFVLWFLSGFGLGVSTDFWRFLSDLLWCLSDFGQGVEKFKQFVWRFFFRIFFNDFWMILDQGSRRLK